MAIEHCFFDDKLLDILLVLLLVVKGSLFERVLFMGEFVLEEGNIAF